MKTTENSLKKELAPVVLEVIRKMTRSKCPSAFFNFDGRESGLVVDRLQFPSSAYSFCTWLRIERIWNNRSSRFFSMFDSNGNGLELLFKGNRIVFQVSHSKRSYQFSPDYFFHTNRWYFICYTHTRKVLFTSEVKFYVDGDHKQSFSLNFPKFSKELSFCHFGTNIPYNYTSVNAFCGQCGPIAFFDKPLSHEDIKRIFSCGSDFQFTFKQCDAVPFHFNWPSVETMGTKIFLLYNPRACSGALCYGM